VKAIAEVAIIRSGTPVVRPRPPLDRMQTDGYGRMSPVDGRHSE
jgi:hypothetical protein